MFKRPVRTLKQLFQTAKFCSKITPLYSLSYPTVLSRAVRLCRQGRFLPDEAFHYGLFNPDLPQSEIFKFVSRKNLTKVQKSTNPVSWAPLLNDKGIFYRYCMASGVPVPKLFAIFFRNMAGWAFDGSYLRSRDDWKCFLESHIPSEFVIKPVNAAIGYGVNIFTGTEGSFIDAFGKKYSAADIYDTMFSDRKYDSFIIQQRLNNHPELVRLSDTRFLQTVRIITFIDSDSRYHILHAILKVITRQSLTDNVDWGRTGNITAEISLDDGVLKSAVAITLDGTFTKPSFIHPTTGISLKGFQVPLWLDMCELLKETAPKFLPIRAIAWDVALTPTGPIVVEGNFWWDAPNQHRCVNILLDKLSCDLKYASSDNSVF